ncbi:unnamed protein product [Discosporangium mesarthrocarpum]
MPETEGAWVADYFSLVGSRSDDDLELLDPELHSPEMLKCIWEDAITDIAVIRSGRGETCPEGYELIERTPNNHKADLNHGQVGSWRRSRAVHLAVRRQHVSKRKDYIADIQIVYPNLETPPEGNGWDLITRSVSGMKAKLNKGGEDVLLAVRRVVRDPLDCPPAVCSLCVLLRSKDEHPPPGYRVIQKDLNKGKFGDVVHLAYQMGGALSLCRLPYRAVILDRYPETDSAMFPFPGDQLPMFVYPKGMLLERRPGNDTPKPSFFSFVFTNVDGRRTYTACLTFYEPMAPSAVRQLKQKLVVDRVGDTVGSHSLAGGGSQGDAPGAETSTEVRVGLQGGLAGSSILNSSQHSGPRSRSGTGTWSGAGPGAPPWPRRGGLGAVGQSSGLRAGTWTRASSFSNQTRKASVTSLGVTSLQEVGSGASQSPTLPLGTGPQHKSEGSFSLISEISPGMGLSNINMAKGAGLGEEPCQLEAGGLETAAEEGGHVLVRSTSENSFSTDEESTWKELGASACGVSTRDGRGGLAHNPQGGDSEDMSDAELDLAFKLEGLDCVFAPKTICVISRFPIYGVLRRFLRHLYAISLSSTGVPLERYISMFVSCIPMPFPGGRHLHVYLEPLENEDPHRSRLKPITLQMPPDPWLPLMDIDFSAPFRCLSVHSVLVVFALMLQEAKILFLSSRAELLTQVMETLRSLLFPLEWQSVYVPQLPYALSGCLECPGGFMIGMRLTKGELLNEGGGTSAIIRDLGLDGVANAVNLDTGEVRLCSGAIASKKSSTWQYLQKVATEPLCTQVPPSGLLLGGRPVGSPSDQVLIIDGCFRLPQETHKRKALGRPRWEKKRNYLLHFRRNTRALGTNGNSLVELGEEERATPWLPHPLHADIESRLSRELFGKAGIRVGAAEDLDQYESAFEFAPVPDSVLVFLRHFLPLQLGIEDWCNTPRMYAASTAHASIYGVGAPSSSAVGEFEATLVIRDCFVCCMAELLGGIGGFVRRSEAKRSRHSLRTRPLDELFNMRDFLGGVDKRVRPFVQRLTSTQMFWVMVQQWLESSEKDDQLVFFEECVTALKNRRAGAVVPIRDDGLGGASGLGAWSQDDYIPLVDEVRLKRPDLYGYNATTYGPPHLRGSLTTPMATPSHNDGSDDQQKSQWEGKGGTDAQHGQMQWSDVRLEISKRVFNANRGVEGAGKAADMDSDPSALSTPSDRMDGPLLDLGLQLMESGAYPIIIPGPTKQGLPKIQSCYRYDDGWPTPLQCDLLHTPPEALPAVVLKLQQCALTHKEHHHRRPHGRGAPLGTSLMYGEFEPMVVLPFPAFKAAGAILRSNEAQEITVSYASLKLNRNQVVVIFLSHRWLQPRSNPPHPDKDDVKHALVCAGVEKLLQGLPQGVQAYLWVDYSCIDQDDAKRRKRGIRSMPSYIERCDALLIPYTAADGQASAALGHNFGIQSDVIRGNAVPDEDRINVDPTSSHGLGSLVFHSQSEMLPEKSMPKNSRHLDGPCGEGSEGNPFAGSWDNGWPARYPTLAQYASRAWCRAELYMGSNVPVPPNGFYYFDHVGMVYRGSDRPLFVYGPEQHAHGAPPAVLPRLDKAWFKKANPVEAFLTQESDRREIFALIERVQCTTPAPPKPGYRGEKRLWRRHGKGYMVFEDGRVYDGEWRDGKMVGHGVMEFSRGSRYKGEWKGGKKYGHGSMTYPDGARYDGMWIDGRRHGRGIYIYASGAVYDGEWEEGKMNGEGCYTSANGSRYQGAYRRGKRSGQGRMQYGDGRTYTGEWECGVRNGYGTYIQRDGAKYEGHFLWDRKHGPGKLEQPSGAVVQQEWKDGQLLSEI